MCVGANGCSGGELREMSAGEAVSGVIAIGLLIFLAFALLRPERF
jgi:K+-transporting ATPase KdpF subunit